MPSPYQTPTKRVAAEVFIDDGTRLVGDLHVHPNALAPGGYESVLDMMNEDESFFPLMGADGAVALVAKGRTVSISCLEVGEAPANEGEAQQGPVPLKLGLSGGRELLGCIVLEVPSVHPRTLEFLNGPGAFVPIYGETCTHLVNRAHIRVVHPLD